MTDRSHNDPAGCYDPFTAPMVTGHGVQGAPTGSITYEDLIREATLLSSGEEGFDWPCVVKENARWFLPSTKPSRHSADQVAGGMYVALVVDVDQGRSSFSDIERAVLAATGGAVALVFSTKSATYSNPRWRVVIPLEQPLPGADYAETAKALYSQLHKLSDGRVSPDQAMAKPAQISFLPNAPVGDPTGDDYLLFAAEIGSDPNFALDLTETHPIVLMREAQRCKAVREAEAAAEQAKHRRRSGSGTGVTLITRFNNRHSLNNLLLKYAYEMKTDYSGRWPTGDWRSPYQTSGSYATRVFGEGGDMAWVSLSGSDAKHGLGAKSANGGARFGDAFDLYVHFEHGGDIGAALEAWKAQCDDRLCVEVGQRLARRREQDILRRDQLRALRWAPIGVKANDTSENLERLSRLGRRDGGGPKR